MIISIVVAAGTGTTTTVVRGRGDVVSVIAPVASPNFGLEFYDEDGYIVYTSAGLTTKYVYDDSQHFDLDGSCTFKVVNATDAGTYTVKIKGPKAAPRVHL